MEGKLFKKSVTVDINIRFIRVSLLMAAILFLGFLSACNDKTEETDDIAITSSMVAVKDFYIKSNAQILSNLDSVFFSIDLKNGVIFNADSLPKGTDVSRLIPVITFFNSMSEAKITYTEGNEEIEVDYLKNASDSINFTSPVRLDVKAQDGKSKFSYTLKVNVHKQEPDSMIWTRLAVSNLPSRLDNPRRQKTVASSSEVYCLIEESDGSYTVATNTDINNGSWNKQMMIFPFSPDVESLSLTNDGKFWILDAKGELFISTDWKEWTPCDEKWVSMIGAFGEWVLGLKFDNGILKHCHYPYSPDITDSVVEEDFPIHGSTSPGLIENSWARVPTLILVGGVTSDGELSSATWAFDGNTWTTIEDRSTPALEGATLVKYVVYRNTGIVFTQKEYDAWLIIGGKLNNGEFNRTLYVSLDNGVNWSAASEMMQLPDSFPELVFADGIVTDSTLEADITDNWRTIPSKNPGRWFRISYSVDDYEIEWDCPYIYIFGGELPEGNLSTDIWRGVLSRLTFTPIF